jgi:hypothetical protein
MSGFAITRRDVDDMISFMQNAQGRALDYKKPAENAMGVIGSQVESGFAAFSYGMLEGAYGPITVGPVPADGLLALALHGLGLFGVFGGAEGHAHNFAQGLADSALHRLGAGLGNRLATQHAAAKTSGTSAHPYRGENAFGRTDARGREHAFAGAPAPRIKPMTEAEIAAHVNAIR